MQDTPLGKSNMRVSRLALGSMMAMTMAGTASVRAEGRSLGSDAP